MAQKAHTNFECIPPRTLDASDAHCTLRKDKDVIPLSLLGALREVSVKAGVYAAFRSLLIWAAATRKSAMNACFCCRRDVSSGARKIEDGWTVAIT